jgi:hypothetical protein
MHLCIASEGYTHDFEAQAAEKFDREQSNGSGVPLGERVDLP